MTQKIVRFIATLLGAFLGFIIIWSFFDAYPLIENQILEIVVMALFVLLFGFIFYWATPKVLRMIGDYTTNLEQYLNDYSTKDILAGTIGLIIGLLLAFLVSQPLYRLELPVVGNVVTVIISIVLFLALGYVGIRVAVNNKENISQIFQNQKQDKENKESNTIKAVPKILDTSVIIDGRIKDIAETGFLEGDLLVPVFVLEELQHIADSDNDLRRQKGRRGLDVLKTVQKELEDRVIITTERYPEIEEVDSKLLKMAHDKGAKVLTNDFNLNKVANVQNIEVLNINELANAMKPVVFPGERMDVAILKEGKEMNQGIGYLDDGTMIVVENGKDHIGETVETLVTSVLQTAAGKMIFVRIDKK